MKRGRIKRLVEKNLGNVEKKKAIEEAVNFFKADNERIEKIALEIAKNDGRDESNMDDFMKALKQAGEK